MGTPLFERYANEAAFREEFVRPFLNRIGFTQVTLYHGPSEFGKDFVVCDRDRLGYERYYAIQVKHLKSLTKRHARDVLDQVREAFNVPADLGPPIDQKHMSGVYVMNSGHMTTHAVTAILAELQPWHRGNVVFLDGERLDAIDRYGARQSSGLARARLLALRNQLLMNAGLLQHMRTTITQERVPLEAPLTQALDLCMAEGILPRLASRFLELRCAYGRVTAKRDRALFCPFSVDARRREREEAMELLASALDDTTELMAAVDAELLNPGDASGTSHVTVRLPSPPPYVDADVSRMLEEPGAVLALLTAGVLARAGKHPGAGATVTLSVPPPRSASVGDPVPREGQAEEADQMAQCRIGAHGEAPAQDEAGRPG